MAWKSYAIGAMTVPDALTSAASILNGIFDSCVAGTDGYTLTLSHGGNTYTVPASNASSTATYNFGLFVDDATGAFLLSTMTVTYPNTSGKTYTFIAAALLEIQTSMEQTTLVPIANYNVNYGLAFGVPTSSSTGTNKTNFVTLIPVVTNTSYNANLTDCLYRPVIGLFTSNVNTIAAGTTIEVAGQRFLCVATGLFAKL